MCPALTLLDMPQHRFGRSYPPVYQPAGRRTEGVQCSTSMGGRLVVDSGAVNCVILLSYHSHRFGNRFQLIEAHIGIYEGGRAAQQAYYVYDELAQNPAQAGTSSIVTSLTGKAVARMVSSEYDDAAASLTQAIELDPKSADALANRVPLSTLGKKTGQTEALQEALAYVERLRVSLLALDLMSGFFFGR